MPGCAAAPLFDAASDGVASGAAVIGTLATCSRTASGVRSRIQAAASSPATVIATKTKTNAVVRGMFRRSVSPPAFAPVSPAPGAAPAAIGRPHSTQNFAPAISGAPHCGQNRISKFLHERFQPAQQAFGKGFPLLGRLLYIPSGDS